MKIELVSTPTTMPMISYTTERVVLTMAVVKLPFFFASTACAEKGREGDMAEGRL